MPLSHDKLREPTRDWACLLRPPARLPLESSSSPARVGPLGLLCQLLWGPCLTTSPAPDPWSLCLRLWLSDPLSDRASIVRTKSKPSFQNRTLLVYLKFSGALYDLWENDESHTTFLEHKVMGRRALYQALPGTARHSPVQLAPVKISLEAVQATRYRAKQCSVPWC